MNGVIACCGRCVNAIRICPHAKIPIIFAVPEPPTLQGCHMKDSVLYSRNHTTVFKNEEFKNLFIPKVGFFCCFMI